MKNKIFETLLETLEDIQSKYEKMLKDMEKIVSSYQFSYSLSLDNKEKIDIILKDLEKKQNLIVELNKKIIKNNNDILLKTENFEKLNKVLSKLIYDFHNLKENNQKQFLMLENKIILLESKINMRQDNLKEKEILTSLNEIKDTLNITIKNINTKVNELFKRLELINDRQRVYEIMLKLSISNDKLKIKKYLDELQIISKKLKDNDNLDEELKLQLNEYFDNMSSFWINNGFEDISQMFKERKSKIEIM